MKKRKYVIYFLFVLFCSTLSWSFGYYYYSISEQERAAYIYKERLALYSLVINDENLKLKTTLATLLRGDLYMFSDGRMNKIDLKKFKLCASFNKIKDKLKSFYQERNDDIDFIHYFDERCELLE